MEAAETDQNNPVKNKSLEKKFLFLYPTSYLSFLV